MEESNVIVDELLQFVFESGRSAIKFSFSIYRLSLLNALLAIDFDTMRRDSEEYSLLEKEVISQARVAEFPLQPGLSYDTIVQDDHGGLYNSPNEALTNEAWESMTYDLGSVALDSHYAASMGLPPAQPYPWDESKSIYFLNAHHGLHCLKLMRRTFIELRDQKPLSLPLEHTFHCFNALRQDVICAADDTPRKTSFEHPGTIGVGQERTCRSWDKLERWAKERWSCWRDINDTEKIDTLLRYRYCPKESPYYERIHAIFGDFEMGPNASATT
ncbi:MAG: hypothetical protein Q9167_005092 [Letrouitia subvulpina]